MSKRIKLALPVRADEDNDLVDAEGYCIAYEGCVAPHSAVTAELALRINNHERLVEALRKMERAEDCSRDAPGILFDAAEEARALLAALEAEKGGE